MFPRSGAISLVSGLLLSVTTGAAAPPAHPADGLGDYLDGMVACPAGGTDRYAAFTGHGSRYVDDVRAWQTDEPALDMTGSAILGAALQSAVDRPGSGLPTGVRRQLPVG